MVETEKVIEKLSSEGLDASLANGVSFEDEDKLNDWVSSTKTIFSNVPKGLEQYTKEELKELADKGGNKALQSLLDEIRTKASQKAKEASLKEPNLKDDKYEALESQLKEFKALIESQNAANQEEKFNQMVKDSMNGFDELEIEMIKALLPKTATQAEIKAKVDAYIALQTKQGLSSVRAGQAKPPTNGELPKDYMNAFQALKQKK